MLLTPILLRSHPGPEQIMRNVPIGKNKYGLNDKWGLTLTRSSGLARKDWWGVMYSLRTALRISILG